MNHKTLAEQFFEAKNYTKYLYHTKQQYLSSNSTEDLKEYKRAEKLKETYDKLQDFLKIPKDDYYKILGVTKDDLTQLRENYKRLSKQFHPEISKIQECKEAFFRIQNAYSVLNDDRKRREYDNRHTRMPVGNMDYNMFFYEMARRRNVESFDDFENIFRPEYYVHRRYRRCKADSREEGPTGVALIVFLCLFLFISMI